MRSPVPFHVTVEPLDDARLIRAAGELELSTAPALSQELDEARDTGATALLDLADVTFIDSSGLQLLLEASRQSAESDWAFFIVRTSEAVRRLVELSRTADLLTLADRDAQPVL